MRDAGPQKVVTDPSKAVVAPSRSPRIHQAERLPLVVVADQGDEMPTDVLVVGRWRRLRQRLGASYLLKRRAGVKSDDHGIAARQLALSVIAVTDVDADFSANAKIVRSADGCRRRRRQALVSVRSVGERQGPSSEYADDAVNIGAIVAAVFAREVIDVTRTRQIGRLVRIAAFL